ncbi:DUF805 domain-containing protein [Novosphingobium sp. 9U]|uniref:DUF805 domain-containing protein n=1 Tax=Novosphingobium sp. 9U TaxID=2653158 RepID=UPI0012F356D3|nr:DUF805 domain-containing protein [Novosphingobium sp. 9U]VWX46864.1 Membrane protein [Novosphingobium sp. 9U]
MLEYMFLPFRRYADLNGRSRRMEFWAFGLFNLIVYAVIGGIMIGTGVSLSALQNGGSDPVGLIGSLFFGGAGLLLLLYWLATLIPTLAVTVRRLHDRDMSGWWYLGVVVLSFIPLVGSLVGIAFLVLMLLPGTAGPNRFGSDPKDPASSQVFA